MTITIAAGQRLTADVFNAVVPFYLRKGSDESKSGTSFANDSVFAAISIGAGQVWEFHTYLALGGTEAGDFKRQWTTTGGLTIYNGFIISVPTTETTGNAADEDHFGLQVRAYNASVSAAVDASASIQVGWQERMVVETTTAGTFTLQWAQASASGSAIVTAHSWMLGHRVS